MRVESTKCGWANSAVVHLAVFWRVGLQQIFIACEKPIWRHAALIPDKRHATTRFQDAAEFLPCRVWLKPVECLSGSDQVHAVIWQPSALGLAFLAGET